MKKVWRTKVLSPEELFVGKTIKEAALDLYAMTKEFGDDAVMVATDDLVSWPKVQLNYQVEIDDEPVRKEKRNDEGVGGEATQTGKPSGDHA